MKNTHMLGMPDLTGENQSVQADWLLSSQWNGSLHSGPNFILASSPDKPSVLWLSEFLRIIFTAFDLIYFWNIMNTLPCPKKIINMVSINDTFWCLLPLLHHVSWWQHGSANCVCFRIHEKSERNEMCPATWYTIPKTLSPLHAWFDTCLLVSSKVLLLL